MATKPKKSVRQIKTELIKSFAEHNILVLKEIELKSGKKSPYYIDLHKVISYPKVFENISN